MGSAHRMSATDNNRFGWMLAIGKVRHGFDYSRIL